MTDRPFPKARKQGVVAVNSLSYVRQMLGNLQNGVVSVPLRHAEDTTRCARADVTEVVTPDADHGWLDMEYSSEGGDRLAQISFTSGTEGVAKAVYLSAGNLHDVVCRLQEVMHLTDEVREYIGVPVYHSFGYARARAVLDRGGRCFVPGAGFQLTELREMLRSGEINAISAVPSLWHLFLKSRDMFGSELDAVRWVEIGSQYMSANDKRLLRNVLPNACIVQHYGLTEASRSTFLRIDTAPAEALEAVGTATGEVRLRIDEAGQVQIRGPHVAMGIDNGTSYQALDPDAWFRTSDRGRLDGDLLYYEGRSDDVINFSGLKLMPEQIEAYVRDTLGDPGEFGVLRRPDAARGEGVLLALGPDALPHKAAIVAAIEASIHAQGANARGSIVTRSMEAPLPRTATGKLQRKRVAQQLQQQTETAGVSAQTMPTDSDTGTTTDLETDIREALSPDVPLDASFHQIGGDSLAHLQLGLAIERAFGGPVDTWEAIPLADLIARAAAMPPSGAIAGTPPLPSGATNMNPPDIGFWQLVREDFRTNEASLAHQGFWMLFVHRFGNWRMDVRPRLVRAPLSLLYRVLNKLTQILFGMKLDYTVKVGRRVRLEHFGGMILGAREIGDDVTLRQNTTLGIRSSADLHAKPTLGARVDVGAGAVIVGNIKIGDNSIIGANSVVFSSIPDNSVVMGVPGRIIGTNPRRNPSPLAGHDPSES